MVGWMNRCPKKWDKAKKTFIRVVVMNVVFTKKWLFWMSSLLYVISWEICSSIHPSNHTSLVWSPSLNKATPYIAQLCMNNYTYDPLTLGASNQTLFFRIFDQLNLMKNYLSIQWLFPLDLSVSSLKKVWLTNWLTGGWTVGWMNRCPKKWHKA